MGGGAGSGLVQTGAEGWGPRPAAACSPERSPGKFSGVSPLVYVFAVCWESRARKATSLGCSAEPKEDSGASGGLPWGLGLLSAFRLSRESLPNLANA